MSQLPPNMIPEGVDPASIDPIDAYFDGLMTPEQTAAFIEQIKTDAALRERFELQQRINESARRSLAYVAPTPQAITETVRAATIANAAPLAFRAPAIPTRLRWLLAAAAAVLLATAGVLVYKPTGVKPFPPEQYYTQQVANNWKPQWVCESDEEFVRWTNFHFKSPVLISMSTPGIQVMGWNFAPRLDQGTPLNNTTLALLTRVGDDRVLVLMDEVASDRKISVPESSGLKLFRRVVGNIVMYELTPRNEESIINHAVITAPPPRPDMDPLPNRGPAGAPDGGR